MQKYFLCICKHRYTYDLTVPTIIYKGEGGKPHWTKQKSKARHSSKVCLSLGLWVTNDRGKAWPAFRLPTPWLSLETASNRWWVLVEGRREAAHSWWSENQGPQAHKDCTMGKTLWPQVSGFKNRKGETSTEQIWNQSMEVEWIIPNPAFSDTYSSLCERDRSFPWECFCHFVIMLHMVRVVGEEPSRGHQRTGPTEEEKGAKTGTYLAWGEGLVVQARRFLFPQSYHWVVVRVLQGNVTNRMHGERYIKIYLEGLVHEILEADGSTVHHLQAGGPEGPEV